MSVDILYIISHGFASRMVIQTGLLENLINSGYTVGVLTPDVNDPNLRSVSENWGLQLYEWPKVNRFEKAGNYKLLRMYLLEDMSNNVALMDKHKMLLRKKNRNPWKTIRPHIFYLLHLLFKYVGTLKHFFRRFEKVYLSSRKIKNWLIDINPRCIVSTYPVSIKEGSVLWNAKSRNIETIIHLLSWDNISCKGHFPSLANHYISWGPIMTDELVKYYNIEKKRIYETGVPHFDIHHKTTKAEISTTILTDLDLNPSRPYVLFAMSSPYFAPGEIEIVEYLADWVCSSSNGESLQLIIRPHPQNVTGYMADKSWLSRLEKLKSELIAIDYPNLSKSNLPWSMDKKDMVRLSALLANATLCINSGSTMSIDALMTNTPVIITSFDGKSRLPYWQSARRLIDFPHLSKFISFNGVSIVESYNGLINEIMLYQKDKQRKVVDRAYTRDMETYKNDGRATDRVVDSIIEIIKK